MHAGDFFHVPPAPHDSWVLGDARLRVEQSGIRPDQQKIYQGAQQGWQKFLADLERVVKSLLLAAPSFSRD
jgi:hypothetical protein